jgi:hypothetical protein
MPPTGGRATIEAAHIGLTLHDVKVKLMHWAAEASSKLQPGGGWEGQAISNVRWKVRKRNRKADEN